MNKMWIIYVIIAIIVGIIIGVLVYNLFTSDNEELQGTDLRGETELAENRSEGTITNKVNLIETSASEEHISPNAIIIKKEYFKSCDHLVRTVEDIPEKLVNGDESDISKEYPGWKVEEYSPTEIVLYRENEGNCKEHYIVRNHNGVIGIYTINANEEEVFKEDTEISTKYLPETDIELLNKGVKLVGKTKLIEFLEDYE